MKSLRDWVKEHLGKKADDTPVDPEAITYGALFHRPTPKRHFGKRGRGFTKRASGESKKRRVMAKASRRINRKMR